MTFVLMGRSGCGKGTQADLLIERLKATGIVSDKNPLFYLEMGDKFRELINGTSHTSRLAKTVMEKSERQPSFLAISIWSSLLVENLMGDENIIIDGTPRALIEAEALDTAMKFYGRENVCVIHLDVSREWAKNRLEERGRGDDKKPGDIDRRLDWFEKDVVPAINYFEINPDYNYLKINGEQSIEDVHAEIITKLGF